MSTVNQPAQNKREATSIAYSLLKQWSEVTGFVVPNTGYYFEIEGLLDDAIALGRQSAFQEMGASVPEEDFIDPDQFPD